MQPLSSSCLKQAALSSVSLRPLSRKLAFLSLANYRNPSEGQHPCTNGRAVPGADDRVETSVTGLRQRGMK